MCKPVKYFIKMWSLQNKPCAGIATLVLAFDTCKKEYFSLVWKMPPAVGSSRSSRISVFMLFRLTQILSWQSRLGGHGDRCLQLLGLGFWILYLRWCLVQTKNYRKFKSVRASSDSHRFMGGLSLQLRRREKTSLMFFSSISLYPGGCPARLSQYVHYRLPQQLFFLFPLLLHLIKLL